MRIVDCHVQASAEEVLVNLRVQTWRHQGSMRGQRSLTLAQTTCAQAARQLRLKLDRSILRTST